MSARSRDDNEPFLRRWSRRKTSVKDESKAPKTAKTIDADADATVVDAAGATASTQPVDADGAGAHGHATPLPSVDTLTGASDFSVFVRPGVPAPLTQAALRKAWLMDPAIRDFIGLSENAFDFNASDSATGFGELASDASKSLAQAMQWRAPDHDPPIAEHDATAAPSPSSTEDDAAREENEDDALLPKEPSRRQRKTKYGGGVQY